jgi:hypothetical protein
MYGERGGITPLIAAGKSTVDYYKKSVFQTTMPAPA